MNFTETFSEHAFDDYLLPDADSLDELSMFDDGASYAQEDTRPADEWR